MVVEDVPLAVHAAVADVPELDRVDAVEQDVLHLDLPHVRGVRRQHVDQLHRLQAHADQVLELLVQRDRQVPGHRHLVPVVLVLDDDALLRRAEERHLERLVGDVLHGHDHALEDGPFPGDLALDHGLVERPVLRALAGRPVRHEAAQVLRDEVEDRLQLEAGRLPLVVLRAVAQDVQPRVLLLARADLAGVLVGHPQVHGCGTTARSASRAPGPAASAAGGTPIPPRPAAGLLHRESPLISAFLLTSAELLTGVLTWHWTD